MPVQLILIIAAIIAIVFGIRWIKNSKWFDQFATDLTTEKDFSEPKTTEVIDKIGKAEEGLGERAEEQDEQAKKLQEESGSIKEFLDNRGVSKDGDVKTEKGEREYK